VAVVDAVTAVGLSAAATAAADAPADADDMCGGAGGRGPKEGEWGGHKWGITATGAGKGREEGGSRPPACFKATHWLSGVISTMGWTSLPVLSRGAHRPSLGPSAGRPRGLRGASGERERGVSRGSAVRQSAVSGPLHCRWAETVVAESATGAVQAHFQVHRRPRLSLRPSRWRPGNQAVSSGRGAGGAESDPVCRGDEAPNTRRRVVSRARAHQCGPWGPVGSPSQE